MTPTSVLVGFAAGAFIASSIVSAPPRLNAAWKWLAIASESAASPAVDHLLVFLFASNVAPDTGLGRASYELVRERVGRLVVPSDAERHLERVPPLQAIATAYAGARTGDFRVADLLTRRYGPAEVESLVRPSPDAQFSPVRVNELMSISMLTWLRITSRRDLDRLVSNARAAYVVGDTNAYYFAAHVVFALSELGRQAVGAQHVEPEMALLATAATDERIRCDNDLWPEVYLAVTLVRGCQPHRREHLHALADQQLPDGAWSPTTLPETSRYHTTAMMFLALLADSRCARESA